MDVAARLPPTREPTFLWNIFKESVYSIKEIRASITSYLLTEFDKWHTYVHAITDVMSALACDTFRIKVHQLSLPEKVYIVILDFAYHTFSSQGRVFEGNKTQIIKGASWFSRYFIKHRVLLLKGIDLSGKDHFFLFVSP